MVDTCPIQKENCLMNTQPEPRMEVLDITPEYAIELLSKNTNNRTVRQTLVNQLSDAMLSGTFRFTGEPIRIDYHGKVFDGQHRLYAIVESEVTQRMPVWFNLEPEVVHVTDTGRVRTLNDALHMRGERNLAATAALINTLLLWDTRGLRGQYLFHPGGETIKPQIPEQLAFYAEHKDEIHAAFNATNKIPRVLRIQPRVLGLAHILFSRISPEDATAFFDQFATGLELTSKSPIYALRRRLTDLSEDANRNPTPEFLLALFFKAWNFWRDGTEISYLKYVPGGANKEPFPEPH